MKQTSSFIFGLWMLAMCASAQCPKGFFDWKALDNVSDYREEIVDSIRPFLKSNALLAKIHSEFIEVPGYACHFDGTPLIPKLGNAWLEPFYPNYYLMHEVTDQKTGKSVCGVVDVDGNEVIPVNFLSVQLDENGFVTCYGEGGSDSAPTVMYTFDGRRLFSCKDGSGIKNDTEHRVFIVSSDGENGEWSDRQVLYYDGQEVTPHLSTSSLVFKGNSYETYDLTTKQGLTTEVRDFRPDLHSDPVMDRKKFLLPIRESFLQNRWIRLATSYCDSAKWEDALMCLYQFNHVDYQPYMKAVPECLLFANMWLTCNKELGLTDVIRKEFNHMVGYNILYMDEKIISPSELEDKKLQEELLEQCREKALPILIPDYEARQERERQAHMALEKARAKQMKDAQKAERRQRRAELWGAILLGLAQGLNNVTYNSYHSSPRPSQAVSDAAPRNRTVAAPTRDGSAATSSSAAPATTRKKCSRCDGSGSYVVEHSMTVATYGNNTKRMKSCSVCGKSYDSSSTGHRHERCSYCHGSGYWEFN